MADFRIQHEEAGMQEMAHKKFSLASEQESLHLCLSDGNITKPRKEILATVTLADGEEIRIACPEGKYTSGLELHEKVCTSLGLDRAVWQYFAVWVASESLQLQMKPHHMPFKVMKKMGRTTPSVCLLPSRFRIAHFSLPS